MTRSFLALVCLCALSGLFNTTLFAADYTNTALLRTLSRLEANRGEPFSLKGSVTFVDRERNLFVLQDEAGCIAIHPNQPVSVHSGDVISARAEHATPYVVNFPAYPYERAGSSVCTNFESPSDWGNFHLTRLSGFLRP